MLLVTCANGQVGHRIVPYLLEKGQDIRVMDLNPKVKDYLKLGSKDAVVGNGTDEKVLDKAMKGIDAVLYIPPLFTYQEAKMGKMAIDAAIKAGVKQFIDISVLFPLLDNNLQHRMKTEVERYLMYRGWESHMLWTVLQPAGYHHNLYVKPFYESGQLPSYSPLDQVISMVDARDEADVALKVLADPEGYDKGVFTLSNEKFSIRQVAALMSDVTGKEIKPVFVPKDKLKDYWPDYFLGSDSYAEEAFWHIYDSNTRWDWDGNSKEINWLLDGKTRSLRSYFEEEAAKAGIPVHKKD
ncbi:NAD(P)H azoreductase [Secundilactobacillus pentosiphilus]|uniref:NAD(P)H azoreductase n=1 Tax=Secundilactobacillus pentosiphilus TaxID=1714682 RepID=A0A1Z5IL83_9LACO|nr:NmrA family NAD(P)-binding protein [Secundilactobacillus pentosiphilus]GAX02459.1 NAD(P)H azoreductase [Secundilactobacillus pentosiphilus]